MPRCFGIAKGDDEPRGEKPPMTNAEDKFRLLKAQTFQPYAVR